MNLSEYFLIDNILLIIDGNLYDVLKNVSFILYLKQKIIQIFGWSTALDSLN